MYSKGMAPARAARLAWLCALALSPQLACDCSGPVAAEGEGEGEGENQPGAPSVTITAPTAGDAFSRGESIIFRCDAIDVEDGPIPNGDIGWASSVDGALGIGATVQTALVTAGAHTIACSARDSDGLVGVDSIDITVVDNFAPDVTIFQPADGTYFTADQTITFTGSALDAEDGALSGVDLVWTDNGGPLGAGATVSTALPLGDHTVVLAAADGDGATGTASVVIHVVDNLPPLCTITNPNDGATVRNGDTVNFRSVCTNNDGPAVDNAAVRWTSDVSGALGVGLNVTTALAVSGAHVVSVCATDPEDAGVEGCDTISLTVYSAPVVVITAPADQATVNASAAVALTGSATDAEDGALVPSWISSLQGALGSGAALNATLAVGKHAVTLTATDSAGFSASDRIELYATPGGLPFSSLIESVSLGAAVEELFYQQGGAVLWASTNNDGVHRLATDLSNDSGYDTGNSSIPDNQVHAVAIADDGTLLVATEQGLGTGCDTASLTGCAVHTQGGLGGELDSDVITALAVLPDGRAVIGTDQCLVFSDFAAGNHRRYCDGDGGGSGLDGDRIIDTAYDPVRGGVYVVTDNGVSFLMANGGGVDNASFSDVDTGVDARSVAVAPSGDVCFGSNDGVVILDRPGNARRGYRQDDGLPSNDVRDVAYDLAVIGGVSREICWAATGGGLGRVDDGAGTAGGVTTADGLPSNDCRAVVVVPVSKKVVGTGTGVFTYQGL